MFEEDGAWKHFRSKHAKWDCWYHLNYFQVSTILACTCLTLDLEILHCSYVMAFKIAKPYEFLPAFLFFTHQIATFSV